MNHFFCCSKKKRASKIQMSHKKKKPYYFPLNPGCLIVLRIMVDLNPHITRQLFIPYKSPNNNCLGPFFHCSNGEVLATRTKISMEKYLKHRLCEAFRCMTWHVLPRPVRRFQKKHGFEKLRVFSGFFFKDCLSMKKHGGKNKKIWKRLWSNNWFLFFV